MSTLTVHCQWKGQMVRERLTMNVSQMMLLELLNNVGIGFEWFCNSLQPPEMVVDLWWHLEFSCESENRLHLAGRVIMSFVLANFFFRLIFIPSVQLTFPLLITEPIWLWGKQGTSIDCRALNQCRVASSSS